jgi:hypothetical protein
MPRSTFLLALLLWLALISPASTHEPPRQLNLTQAAGLLMQAQDHWPLYLNQVLAERDFLTEQLTLLHQSCRRVLLENTMERLSTSLQNGTLQRPVRSIMQPMPSGEIQARLNKQSLSRLRRTYPTMLGRLATYENHYGVLIHQIDEVMRDIARLANGRCV